MPRIAFYYQDCPICGRTLLIRVEYLGRQLICQHCRGHFTAQDPQSVRPASEERSQNLLDRANQLLNSLHVPAHGHSHSEWN